LDKSRNNLQKSEYMYVYNITRTSKNYLNPHILLQNRTPTSTTLTTTRLNTFCTFGENMEKSLTSNSFTKRLS
jgi:hypothetical protein